MAPFIINKEKEREGNNDERADDENHHHQAAVHHATVHSHLDLVHHLRFSPVNMTMLPS